MLAPRLAHLVAAGIAAPLLTVAAAGAAAAHGAPLDPVSRSAACGSDGSFTQTAACRAARAGDEGQWFEQWDNVRVANVAGRDRETIPDGRLCSGGIADFGGLDLARSDWPSTKVKAGKAVTVGYRGTIPHQGTFRMYVTKDGYDPKQPLRWADLEAKPFLTAKDPSFAGGAYSFKGTLPSGKVGRHILYTIWQNSSTPDTYYSCSDVVFAKPASVTATSEPATAPAAKRAKSAADSADKSPTSKPSASATAGLRPTSAASASPAAVNVSLGAAENLSNDVGGSRSNHPSYLMSVITAVGLLALARISRVVIAARRSRRTTRRRH